jgi:hypothetical protein
MTGKRIAVTWEKVTLCTGHKVYHVNSKDTRDCLEYGEGLTIKQAVTDFEARSNMKVISCIPLMLSYNQA